MVEMTRPQVEKFKTDFCMRNSCFDCRFRDKSIESSVECSEPTVEEFAKSMEISIVDSITEIKLPCKMYYYCHPRIKEVEIVSLFKPKSSVRVSSDIYWYKDSEGKVYNPLEDHIYPSIDFLKEWLIVLFQSDIASNQHAIKTAERNIQIAEYRIKQVATANVDTKFVDRFQFDFDKGDI